MRNNIWIFFEIDGSQKASSSNGQSFEVFKQKIWFEPEISHAALGPCDKVIRNGRLKWPRFVVLNVEGQGTLEELDGEVVLSDGVEDEADIAVDESDFGMIFPDDDQGKVSSAVKQFEGGAEMAKYYLGSIQTSIFRDELNCLIVNDCFFNCLTHSTTFNVSQVVLGRVKGSFHQSHPQIGISVKTEIFFCTNNKDLTREKSINSYLMFSDKTEQFNNHRLQKYARQF